MMTIPLQIPVAIQFLLVLLAIVGVLLLMAGVKEMMTSGYRHQEDDTARLRSDVKYGKNVITNSSLFHRFLSDTMKGYHRSEDDKQ